jgi:hypothetical protein
MDRGIYLLDLRIGFGFRSVDLFDFRGSVLIAATQLDDVREVPEHWRTAFYASGQLEQSRINGSVPRRFDFRFLNLDLLDDEGVGGDDSRPRAHIGDRCPALSSSLGDVPMHGRLRRCIGDRGWNLNLASDDPTKKRRPMTVRSTQDNGLCFRQTVPTPHSKLEMIGTRAQLAQIAKSRGARPSSRNVEQRWLDRSADDSGLSERRPREQDDDR